MWLYHKLLRISNAKYSGHLIKKLILKFNALNRHLLSCVFLFSNEGEFLVRAELKEAFLQVFHKIVRTRFGEMTCIRPTAFYTCIMFGRSSRGHPVDVIPVSTLTITLWTRSYSWNTDKTDIGHVQCHCIASVLDLKDCCDEAIKINYAKDHLGV